MNSDKVRFNRRNKLRISHKWLNKTLQIGSADEFKRLYVTIVEYTQIGTEPKGLTAESGALFVEWRESYEKWLNGKNKITD